MSTPVTPNPWRELRALTQARIALGRAGVSMPTGAQLAFQLAHARARDAVHMALDVPALHAALARPGRVVLAAHSACADRATYLQRPDLGRQLDAPSCAALAAAAPAACELALVVADGLSAPAVAQHAAPFIDALQERLAPDGWGTAPIVIVQQARVAIGDQVGAILNARCVVVLIGERPGLSSPDSMGLYMTWQPGPGLTDAHRNCISNVRAAGVSYREAAFKLHYLLDQARGRGLSGVALKDETQAPPARSGHNFLLR
ncbi:ethanolamine ammonia-lyase subunit EutC [Massilia sp. TSP1-1-2]|uniref:ethanolamine ammonia-lyase subunit EutC n=1 Tax=Massilia sp. TSP1-1-2 TaxID=2804649 RepID=UPI003CED9B21